MAALASELVYAVQDLYDLFQRHNPLGGFRHSLFHDAPAPASGLPAAALDGYRIASNLARGVSCLLANDLPEAALALTAELWSKVRRHERALAVNGWHEPEYYRFLTAELHQLVKPEQVRMEAYRLFGEVLAVQLDSIANWESAEDCTALRQRVARLRRALNR